MSSDVQLELGDLAELASNPAAIDELLRRTLAALREVLPYDLAVLYELDDQELIPRIAEGPLFEPRIMAHRLQLEQFSMIRRALETRRAIALEAHHHASDEGDPYDGLLDLPEGHSCMLIPLFAQDKSLGVITLDRSVCSRYSDESVSLARVYGQITSTAMAFADQAERLERMRHQLREENQRLLEDGGHLDARRKLQSLSSNPSRALVTMARQLSSADLPVLVQGETGVGKEVVSRALHEWSPRADGPFVSLNCAAIPEALVESELFGHVKGAFTGATRDREGRFVRADGGTLLLDEIGDMPLAAQAKLLRVLQEGRVEAVGSDRSRKVDVRVIAASHIDLEAAVREGRFREDLYYRLAALPLRVPPLRERTEDIDLLAEMHLARLAKARGRRPWTLSATAAGTLRAHPWPGNVRQLHNALERASILARGDEIGVSELGLEGVPASVPAPQSARVDPALPSFEQNERSYLEQLLQRTQGRVYGPGGAAELSGLKPTTLQSKIKRAQLRAADFRAA